MSGRTRAYLMTRGKMRNQGYGFLGEVPPEVWWEPVAPWVILESEELVVRRGADGVTGLLISGVPSQRTDVIGTRIRHTVVLDYAHLEPRLALWLVRCGLSDVERTELGEALDTAFDGDLVHALMSDPNADIEDRLLGVLRRAAGDVTAEAGGDDLLGSWTGAVRDETAVTAFLARARNLLEDGGPGYAFTTHAIGSPDGARRAARALAGTTAVLLHESDIRGVEPLGKVPGQAPQSHAPTGSWKAYLVAALVVLAVLLGVWWLVRRL
ncbi:hypothetical protein [Streptomyces torulosus]|uniref:hypothetical protein n=1 Tax=Streptomyces torulosus TaxID=68276 RepID=UPI000AE13F28|nr:hypothetical protein [Streptomyces torulosus]